MPRFLSIFARVPEISRCRASISSLYCMAVGNVSTIFPTEAPGSGESMLRLAAKGRTAAMAAESRCTRASASSSAFAGPVASPSGMTSTAFRRCSAFKMSASSALCATSDRRFTGIIMRSPALSQADRQRLCRAARALQRTVRRPPRQVHEAWLQIPACQPLPPRQVAHASYRVRAVPVRPALLRALFWSTATDPALRRQPIDGLCQPVFPHLRSH